MRNGLRRRQFLNKVRLFQVLEILGALGLILPTFTDILPIRAPLAAVGSALIQVGAVYSDVRRGDYQKRIMNLFLIALAVVASYGRYGSRRALHPQHQHARTVQAAGNRLRSVPALINELA